MPSFTASDGTTKTIPGVYFSTQIRSALPGPLPVFQVPVIVGSAWEGRPYNVDSLVASGETAPGPFAFYGTAGAVGEAFGRGSDLHKAFAMAQRHGLPSAFVVCLSALTRASVIADTATVEQWTVYNRSFGAPGGWTRLSFAAGVLTVQKLKNYAFLSANLSNTATRIELKGDTDWIVVGGVYYVGANGTAVATVEVRSKSVEINANGQYQTVIETVAAFGTAITTANYAMIGEYDTANAETFTGITTGQLFGDAINGVTGDASKIIGAAKHANFSNAVPDTVASLTPIKELSTWVSPTAGTSPAASSTQTTAFITLLDGGAYVEFMDRFEVVPQAYLVAMGDTASHASWRDYATARRLAGFPISITTGGNWGDTVLDAGDSTDPLFRTQALNSQDVSLWGPGLDREAPYLSLAPAVFGRRIAGGPKHNLTNDELIFSHLEATWDEINSGELSRLLRGGFGTVKLSVGRSIRYRVAQGLSTLQNNNGLIWNESTKDTWSLMQRDLRDFIDRVQLVDLEEDIVGADGVLPAVIAGVLRRRAELSLIKRGYLLEYVITAIELNDAGNGYLVRQSYRQSPTADYVDIESTLLIG